MKPLKQAIQKIIAMRASGERQVTLLAICPNSTAVLEAGIRAAAAARAPLLLAATLNQVDRDGGYTGWTPQQFVGEINRMCQETGWTGPIYPCLDHGGPWLKDKHTLEGLSLQQTTHEVKLSLTAFLKAGYQLLHIDPTVDRTLPAGTPPAVHIVVERTLDLICHSERERTRLSLPAIAYEVGTEEVHGGLVDLSNFKAYLDGLHKGLGERGLMDIWPCFIVAQVGTNLHTTTFDPQAARAIFDLVAPLGSLAKGHYTDWVENPQEYPRQGMGGANVGPEFTSEEFLALEDLEHKEREWRKTHPSLESSNFMQTLENSVVKSGRWKKWLQPQELGLPFPELSSERRSWLLQTGARYIWTDTQVQSARQKLYQNLTPVVKNPHNMVVERIVLAMEKYFHAFNLVNSLDWWDTD